jgi:hypothetical protein
MKLDQVFLEKFRTYSNFGNRMPKVLINEKGIATSLEDPENIGKIYDYRINSDGLRCVEFSEKPEILALGCSLTLGTGLPEEHVWPNLLKSMISKKGLDYNVGIIAYNGGSIMKSISAMFSMIHKYDYTPKYILCNFPEIYRYYFISSDRNDFYMQDYSVGEDTDIGVHSIDWIRYINLEYIKMLEVFCAQNGIKLVWSSWAPDASFDDYCLKYFNNYKIEKDRALFNPYPSVKVENYKMRNWEEKKCHEDLLEKFGEYAFNCAYDSIEAKPPIIPSGSKFIAHYGIHRQQHWAEFFYKEAGFDLYTDPTQNAIIDK